MKDRCDENFTELLHAYSMPSLERQAGAVYGMWRDYRLAYFNPAWLNFAGDNGGANLPAQWPLGASVMDAIPEVLRPFFDSEFQQLLAVDEKEPRRLFEHDYECSSDTEYRLFHMTTFPLAGGQGFLVVNSLVVERPFAFGERTAHDPDYGIYRDQNGLIEQCVHCRRTRNLTRESRWDWVPAWTMQIPEHTSHTLCRSCLGHYYPHPEEKLQEA